jgi:hypothetical protein
LIGATDESFISSIIVGTNSQNQVRGEQFWALRPFLKNLEEYAQQQGHNAIYLERRENQYRDKNIERTRVIKPSELVKTVAAMYLFEPNRAARDFRAIRREYDALIFQDDHSVIPYHIACLANYKFEFLVRNQRVDRSRRIYKLYVLFTICF